MATHVSIGIAHTSINHTHTLSLSQHSLPAGPGIFVAPNGTFYGTWSEEHKRDGKGLFITDKGKQQIQRCCPPHVERVCDVVDS